MIVGFVLAFIAFSDFFVYGEEAKTRLSEFNQNKRRKL